MPAIGDLPTTSRDFEFSRYVETVDAVTEGGRQRGAIDCWSALCRFGAHSNAVKSAAALVRYNFPPVVAQFGVEDGLARVDRRRGIGETCSAIPKSTRASPPHSRRSNP
jgi:hypothetical protein